MRRGSVLTIFGADGLEELARLVAATEQLPWRRPKQSDHLGQVGGARFCTGRKPFGEQALPVEQLPGLIPVRACVRGGLRNTHGAAESPDVNLLVPWNVQNHLGCAQKIRHHVPAVFGGWAADLGVAEVAELRKTELPLDLVQFSRLVDRPVANGLRRARTLALVFLEPSKDGLARQSTDHVGEVEIC